MLISKEVAINAICYEVGQSVSITDLIGDGLTLDDAKQLLEQGVVRVSVLQHSLSQSMERCILRSLAAADIAASDIDAVILATESFGYLFDDKGHAVVGPFRDTRNHIFAFLHRLGIRKASVSCATYGACANLLHAFLMAEALINKDLSRNVLVIIGEKFGATGARLMPEAVSIAGDGAAACIVSATQKGGPHAFRLRYVGTAPYKQFTTADDRAKALLEMFRAMRNAAADCYDACALTPQAFRWILLGDYNALTSLTHGKLLGFAPDRIFMKNVGQLGHIPFDPFINLTKLVTDNLVGSGDHVLVFLCGPVSCGAIALQAL